MPADEFLGAGEQGAGRERLPERRGIGEQEGVHVVHRLGARQLTHGEIAFHGGAHRLTQVLAMPPTKATTATLPRATARRLRRTNFATR